MFIKKIKYDVLLRKVTLLFVLFVCYIFANQSKQDSTLNSQQQNPLYMYFLDWTERNHMLCNPSKCKELTFLEKSNFESYPSKFGIPSCIYVSILGVTFQNEGCCSG